MKLFKNYKKLFIYGVMSMSIYMVMSIGTLKFLRLEAGNYQVFDLRPFGYTVSEALMILNYLSQKGLFVYRFIQLPLDFIYPLMLSLFLLEVWKVLTSDKVVYKFRNIVFMIMLFDYLENLGIYMMLQTKENAIIKFSSSMTLMKSMSTTVVMIILTLLCISFVIKKYIIKES